jgi:hypothetical protein
MLVHDWPLAQQYSGVRHGQAIAQCPMGSFVVVMGVLSFDTDLRFLQRVKYLAVEQFISQSPVKNFAVSSLPG